MYSQISANKSKTVLLILVFIALIGGLGYLFSSWQGTPSLFIGLLIFAVVYAVIGYFASAKIALMLAGAKSIAKKEAPKLYRIVENLSITAGLPMPKVYIIHDNALNAFATGRNPQHAAVAVTSGLLENLDDQELEGVIAHELSHVGNYDIRVMGVVLVLVTVVALISDIFFRLSFWGGMGDDDNGPSSNGLFAIAALLAALLAPLIATLLQFAVSRKREYLADASGALLTRYPQGLVNALRKIAAHPNLHRGQTATAHLYIANPLRGKRAGSFIANLFSTHPPIEDRIVRLEEMGSKE